MLGILCVRVLLLDLLMRLDIDIIVEDLELIVLVRLISFIVYLWGVLEDCKLLCLKWFVIEFGIGVSFYKVIILGSLKVLLLY